MAASSWTRLRFITTLALGTLILIAADEPSSRPADQAALKPFANLVGEWRGTGQKQRGSAKGAWTETATWAWNLTKDSASLEMKVTKGKYVETAILRPGATSGSFALDAVLEDGKTRKFAGRIGPRNVLQLVTTDPQDEGVSRITITPLHDTRLLMLLEAESATGTPIRLGEVGYTRSGVAFATGDSSPVCIVTGGRGTIPVSFEGKTYYVCCSGCKDLFDDDPASVIAESKLKKDK